MGSAISEDLRRILEDHARLLWARYASSIQATLPECPFCGTQDSAMYRMEPKDGVAEAYHVRLQCSRCFGVLEAVAECRNACVDVVWTQWDETPPTIRRTLEAVAVGPAVATPWDGAILDPDGDLVRGAADTYAPDEPHVPRVVLSWPYGSSLDVVLRLLSKLSRRLEAERASADLEDSGHAAA